MSGDAIIATLDYQENNGQRNGRYVSDDVPQDPSQVKAKSSRVLFFFQKPQNQESEFLGPLKVENLKMFFEI